MRSFLLLRAFSQSLAAAIAIDQHATEQCNLQGLCGSKPKVILRIINFVAIRHLLTLYIHARNIVGVPLICEPPAPDKSLYIDRSKG